MAHQDYQTALETAQRELAELLIKQQHLEQEILRRRRTISSLIELVAEEGGPDGAVQLKRRMVDAWHRFNMEQSITDDIRKIIRAAGDAGIQKDALRSELSKLGNNSVESHSNPSATINSVVKRLIDHGEVRESAWISPTKTLFWVSDVAKAWNKAVADVFSKREELSAVNPPPGVKSKK